MRMSAITHLVAWTSATLALPLLFAAAPAGKLSLKFTETSLGVLPPGMRSDSLVFSADGRHVAYLVKGTSSWNAVLDGKPEKSYEWIMSTSLSIAPDGNRLAYIVQRGELLFVAAAGVESPQYKDATRPIFSPDGKRCAWTARKPAAKGWVVVLDGQESKEYQAIVPHSLRFSPDSKRFAFVAEQDDKRRWVIDGQECPLYTAVAPISFSADSARYAYVAELGGKQAVIIDGKQIGEYTRAGGVSFSPDNKRYVYAAERSGKLFVVADGKEGKEYDMVGEPRFSPDSTRVAHIAIRNKIWMAVVDGEEGQGYDRIGDVVFSGDSKHVAYRVLNEHMQRLVVDGKELKEYDKVGVFALSNDGAHVIYAARAFTTSALIECVVFDDKEYPGTGFITLSPNGKYVAHSLDARAKSKVVINDAEGREYTGFPSGSRWTWETPTRLHLFAARGAELLRVQVDIEG